MKIEINLTNRWLYTFLAFISLLIIGGLAYAYNSGAAPSIMGHSGEEIEVKVKGETKLLNKALDDLTASAKAPLIVEVYNSDTSTYDCKSVNLTDYCKDEDGCVIRLVMQHETDGNDQVRTIDEHIFMEQASMSSNHNSGTYGWTRQEGGGDFSWITGGAGQYTLFDPWDWAWAFNYEHGYCPGRGGVSGPAWADPYIFTFMSHPQVRAKFIVYD